MSLEPTMLIKNISLSPMTKETDFIQHGFIYIKSGRIAAVGEGAYPTPYEQADKIIDGAGMVAIPGLINAHTHTPMSLLRGYADDLPLMEWLENIWAVEDRMTHEDMYWASMLSMAEMIKSGTTTFADMYFGMERIASGVEQSGLRAILAQGIIEGKIAVDEQLASSVSLVENRHNSASGRIQTMLSPHAPYTCSPDTIKKIIKQAEQLEVGIHTHLAETRDEINIIKEKYNNSPIGLMEELGLFTRHVIAAHGVYLSDEDIEILRKSKVGIIHNPKSNMKLASGIAPIATLLKEGVTVGLATDGSASNNVLDMFEEMRFASLLQKVSTEDPTSLTAYETLDMATSNGAKAVGLEKEIGTIEVGKKADITLVNLQKTHVSPVNEVVSHLVYAVKAEDVACTIVDGQILYEKGELLTIDEEEVMWQIDKIQKKLLS
ncbi:amidohydrolase family protein [Virgibacillus sp. W0181]|uniref:amidohydrolase family protein n=1 Tax=Virgibacillus sp. W0181 TaxID=3391581 RepID=UPI003F46C3DC